MQERKLFRWSLASTMLAVSLGAVAAGVLGLFTLGLTDGGQLSLVGWPGLAASLLTLGAVVIRLAIAPDAELAEYSAIIGETRIARHPERFLGEAPSLADRMAGSLAPHETDVVLMELLPVATDYIKEHAESLLSEPEHFEKAAAFIGELAVRELGLAWKAQKKKGTKDAVIFLGSEWSEPTLSPGLLVYRAIQHPEFRIEHTFENLLEEMEHPSPSSSM